MLSLQSKVLLVFSLLAIGLAAPGAADAAVQASAGTTLSKVERTLLQVMNEARTARGLPRLRVDTRLQKAARAHSRDMIRRGYFAHGAFGRRLDRFGVRGSIMAENLAASTGRQLRVRQIVRQWLRSPGHRANLLGPSFRRVGIGAVPGRLPGMGRVRVITADFAGG